MQVTTEKLPKNTLKVTITIPQTDVQGIYENVLAKVIETAEVPGFRVGKAPRDKVLEKTDTNKLYGEVINEALRIYYPQALKEQKVVPAGNPKVEITQFDLDKDLVFIATVPQKPEIKIGDYMNELKKVLADRKEATKAEKDEKLKKGESLSDVHDHLHPADVVQALVKVSELEIPDVMIEEETNRMLARLVGQAEQIGLSLDQFLEAQGKTADQLRADYDKVSDQTIKAEFILAQLVKDREVKVEDSEIREALAASGVADIEAEMKEELRVLYIRSILEKNKLIANILEEADGGGHIHHE
jgi:FKBP-type peptidyl-prolyl cis-trans isomerase (trigger factor)